MTIKKATLKDIIENEVQNCTIKNMKASEREELGNKVIYIEADVEITEKVGKTEIKGNSKMNLIYIVDTHSLLNMEWELIA